MSGTAYELDDIAFVAKSSDLNALSIGVGPCGVCVSNDGVYMRTCDDNGYLRELTFGTPWDPTTLTHTGNGGRARDVIAALSGNPYSIACNDDGTRIYLSRDGTVYVLDVPGGWGTIATNSDPEITLSGVAGAYGVAVDPNEAYLYTTSNDHDIHQYSFDTPGDPAGGVTFVDSLDVGFDAKGNFAVKPGGGKIIAGDDASITLHEITIPTPADISTGSVTQSWANVGTPIEKDLRGAAYSHNGNKLFVIDQEWNNDNSWKVYSFKLADAAAARNGIISPSIGPMITPII